MNYENETINPSRKRRRYWMIHACISALVVLGIAFGIYFGFIQTSLDLWTCGT